MLAILSFAKDLADLAGGSWTDLFNTIKSILNGDLLLPLFSPVNLAIMQNNYYGPAPSYQNPIGFSEGIDTLRSKFLSFVVAIINRGSNPNGYDQALADLKNKINGIDLAYRDWGAIITENHSFPLHATFWKQGWQALYNLVQLVPDDKEMCRRGKDLGDALNNLFQEWISQLQTYDNTPPTPNPMTWATSPYATSSTSISMVAKTANDVGSPPVSYYFDYVDSPTGGTGGSDSEQGSTSYMDTGLQPNHRYGYRVRACDSAPTPNCTSYSSPTIYKSTLANPPGAASFSNVTQTCIRANWTANGNRSGTEYWCENTTNGNYSGWTTNLYWDNCGLTCGTTYAYRVKARNGDGVDTGWTSLGNQSTLPCPDVTPDPFTFIDQTGVALNTVVTSNTITVTGINAAAPISITVGTYSINGGAYTSSSGTVNNRSGLSK